MAVWEWFDPEGLSTSIGFDASNYDQSNVGVFNILDYLENNNLPECNFPVFPLITVIGATVRTDISIFLQYANVSADEIPGALSDQIRIVGQKGRYVGCSEGPNVSASNVNFLAYGPSLKISGISPLPDGTVVVSLGVIQVPAQNLFTQFNNPYVQPFFPYDSSTTTIGGVPIVGQSYLNNGAIQIASLRAHYVPGNKYSDHSNQVDFDFSVI